MFESKSVLLLYTLNLANIEEKLQKLVEINFLLQNFQFLKTYQKGIIPWKAKAHFTDGKMAAASETATRCQEEPLKPTMSFNPKSVICVKQLEQQCALNLNH